jgi:hypothetical protein
MDPYLEASTIWPDVHTSLMNIFREQLNPFLAPKYLAELEIQVVIDHQDDEEQIGRPDVSLTTQHDSGEVRSAAAVAEPLPIRIRLPLDIPTRLVRVYIRQRETATLVAVIEPLSPVNKRRGEGRTEYLEKRRTFLRTRIHFVEIDLLRSYLRMPYDDPLPPADYLLMVAKAGERPHGSVPSTRKLRRYQATPSCQDLLCHCSNCLPNSTARSRADTAGFCFANFIVQIQIRHFRKCLRFSLRILRHCVGGGKLRCAHAVAPRLCDLPYSKIRIWYEFL